MPGGALVVLLVAGLVVPGAGTAEAQYPIVAPDDCAETFDANNEETTTFRRGEGIRVAGGEGCARPNEPNVRGTLEPVGNALFRTDARGDGSYDSGLVSLPSRIAPGDYRVVVETRDNTYVRPIRIVAGPFVDVLDRLRELLRLLRQRLRLLRQQVELGLRARPPEPPDIRSLLQPLQLSSGQTEAGSRRPGASQRPEAEPPGPGTSQETPAEPPRPRFSQETSGASWTPFLLVSPFSP